MTVFTDPSSWGPPGWVFLHCVSLTYPRIPTAADKKKYHRFFDSLGDVLPCKLCRAEYKKWTQKNPVAPHLVSRKALSLWLIDLHNNVNLKKNKKVVPTRDAAIARIRRECVKQQQDKK